MILACALSVHAMSFNTPYTVTDGVYIAGGTQGDAIRTLDAVWSLHVIVGRPKEPVQLFQQIRQIQAIINSSAVARHSDKSIQSSYGFNVANSLIFTWHRRWPLITDIVEV